MTDRDWLRLPLDARSLRDELIDAGLGWRHLDVVDETGSTNADLLARAATGVDIDGAVLIAEHQTAGRGRRGREWFADPRAQIAMSVGVRVADPIRVPVSAWGWLSLATGLAVVDAVAPLIADTAVEAGLKWPNDVLAGPAGSLGKLAGILTEVARPFAVIGVGLNVTQAPAEVEGSGATSLCDLGAPAPDRDQLARSLLRQLAARLVQWRAGDPQLMADYRAYSLTIGSRVRAVLPAGAEVVGFARDIDDDGRLCLEPDASTSAAGDGPGGQTIVISAGDVVHVR
ncbi:biotin--[acetyl-CoA-carboxylase] ligase [Mycobacterium spongiae]|uniref:biotin--[biotin carboxyl-carrier protein] ligase n=1 Tax=Mycobacterium spongiae TaxID=886343 RepID=A0A975JVS9_9MYCO|nr:biotin--[acetyl-CoA-carboxylase] ligase [Mycobacterium spongiae]QUR66600.1 biotin--[acetyl-CoA-carboxylase] ligase [Mycobacterium spongiae]